MSKPVVRIPHIILMLGAHTTGVEKHVGVVLDREKPVKLLVEAVAAAQEADEIIKDIKSNATELLAGFDDEMAFRAGVHLEASQRGVPWDFTERASEEYLRDYETAGRKFKEAFERSVASATHGDPEKARQFHREYATALVETHSMRHQYLVSRLIEEAKKTSGPIAAFMGSAHSHLIKDIVKGGVRVTLYNQPADFYARFRQGYRTISEPQLLRNLFESLVSMYFMDRYELTHQQFAHLPTFFPKAKLLKKIPSTRIEKMMQESRGLTPVRFRRHLVEFLNQNGFTPPSLGEMEEALRRFEFPAFKKVKVFEPKLEK